MRHADLLIHDAQYTPEEYPAKKNWGHSTFEYAVELAAAADVRQLALTHHDPTHDDEQLSKIEERARGLARSRNFSLHVFCAAEGAEIKVVPPGSDRLRTVDVSGTSIQEEICSVLVVDDDPNLRLLVKAALGRGAFTLREAQDGWEGLRQIQALTPDLLLLDVNMPNLDGFEVLKRVRSNPQTHELPVVLLTAQGDEKSVAAGFEAGATDYLVKPFTIPQLTARIRAVLSRASRSISSAGG
jgi:PleD family two-component response regulator